MMGRFFKSAVLRGNSSGLTLVELLVVVVILVVLAGVAVPLFLNQRVKAVQSSADYTARNINSALNRALAEISNPVVGNITYSNGSFVCEPSTVCGLPSEGVKVGGGDFNVGFSPSGSDWFLVVGEPTSDVYTVFNRYGKVSDPTILASSAVTGLIDGVLVGDADAVDPNFGVAWATYSGAEANGWTGVTYGNGTFVAVATNGVNRVMTSPDGVTWTPRTAAGAHNWASVTYGNGLFVAVSSFSFSTQNRVMTSPDGVTWTPRTAAEANEWQSVTYGNGMFVAVARDGTNRVMTSVDGVTWTRRTAAQANSWQSVTYGNGMFVAVARDGTNRVMTSVDGVTWVAQVADATSMWWSVTYGDGLFAAVSFGGTNGLMTSPDGVTWTVRPFGVGTAWGGVTYGNKKIVAVSYSTNNKVLVTPQ